MTLAEARKLRTGDEITVSLGGGWFKTLEFRKLVQVTSYGKTTLATMDDVINRMQNGDGRTEWMVECSWVVNNNTHIEYVRPRAIRYYRKVEQ